MVVTKEVGCVGFPHVNKPFPLGSNLFKQLMWNTMILVMTMDRYVEAFEDWPVATETHASSASYVVFYNSNSKKKKWMYL